MEKNTILVTGGAGFIGSHVCERILGKGDNVVCVDDLNDYYNPDAKESNIKGFLTNEKFKFYRVDIRDFKKLENIFNENKIDKVIHLAARAGVRASLKNPELYFDVNVNGTENLLKLAVKYGIKNFVFGSSSSIYGTNKKIPFSEEDDVNKQISPYAESKKKAEVLCRQYHDKFNMNITCLRFFTVYGPRGRPDMAVYKFTKLISEEKEIELYGSVESKRDYTYISDIVEGVMSALEKGLGFEIINLGNSTPVKLKELVEAIEKQAGKKAKIKMKEKQPGDVLITFADINKAKRLLNYRPKVGIKEGIRKFIEWYNKNKKFCKFSK